MIIIYHNPRCRKSREGLEIVKEAGVDFKVIEYLKTPLTYDEVYNLVNLLGIQPYQLIRTNESIWKEQFKGKELSDQDLIKAMSDFPKLIERPVAVNKDKAVIGRPPAKIREIL